MENAACWYLKYRFWNVTDRGQSVKRTASRYLNTGRGEGQKLGWSRAAPRVPGQALLLRWGGDARRGPSPGEGRWGVPCSGSAGLPEPRGPASLLQKLLLPKICEELSQMSPISFCSSCAFTGPKHNSQPLRLHVCIFQVQ